jgi:hypothetical protein
MRRHPEVLANRIWHINCCVVSRSTRTLGENRGDLTVAGKARVALSRLTRADGHTPAGRLPDGGPDDAAPGDLLDLERRVLVGLTLGPGQVRATDLADPSIRWERLSATARDHRVGALLHRSLEVLAARGRLPPAARRAADDCRALYAQNLDRNTALFDELARVLVALRRGSIPTIALKGAVMAPTLYGDIALRFMYDLDLLVPLEAREQALASLATLGYTVDPGAPADLRAQARRSGLLRRGAGSLDAAQTAAVYARHHFHYYLRRPQQSFPVEIHWHITKPGGGLDIQDFWTTARPVTIHGVEALALGPEHLLLHLCVHLAADSYRKLRLSRFVDLHLAIDRQQIDWELVVRAARHHRVMRLVRVGLGLTRAVLGVPIPHAVTRGGSPAERLGIRLLARWWHRGLGPRPKRSAPLSRTLLWTSLARRRWTDPPSGLYRVLVPYPESNPHLPSTYAGSEVMNLLYAFHPARLRALVGSRTSPRP